MNDSELLTLAAKAANLTIGDGVNEYYHIDANCFARRNANGTATIWNPLADDGDALRLAVAMRIDVLCSSNTIAQAHRLVDHAYGEAYVDGDRLSATRRAIVRAAAEVGMTMP